MIKTIIFIIWILLVIGWNYGVPGATPFEDVFVAICLSLFAGSFEKHSKRKWFPKRRGFGTGWHPVFSRELIAVVFDGDRISDGAIWVCETGI